MYWPCIAGQKPNNCQLWSISSFSLQPKYTVKQKADDKNARHQVSDIPLMFTVRRIHISFLGFFTLPTQISFWLVTVETLRDEPEQDLYWRLLSLLFSSGTQKFPVCVDRHKYCSYWAYAGECKKSSAYMLVNCKYSCNLCGGKYYHIYVDIPV